jgi:hypothetical protein
MVVKPSANVAFCRLGFRKVIRLLMKDQRGVILECRHELPAAHYRW